MQHLLYREKINKEWLPRDKVQVGFFGRGGEGREGNVNHLIMSHILLCFSCCNTTNNELDLGEICLKAFHRCRQCA